MSLKMIWERGGMSSAFLLEMLVEDWHVVLLA
uniref:Pco095461 n=1 Tax=Arundo donax TaxID=35708 RepID=A0A0A9G6E0_ARUDO